MTRKKMRQQLKGKFATKPAYTLECKVNLAPWLNGYNTALSRRVVRVRIPLEPQNIIWVGRMC